MYFIPKITEEFSKLDSRQLHISNYKEFYDLFSIISRKEKAVFKDKKTYLEYFYHFKYGIDQDPIFSITVNEEGDIIDSRCDICSSHLETCHHRLKIANDIKNELEKNLEDSNWLQQREKYIHQKEEEEKQRVIELEAIRLRNESLKQVSSLLSTINTDDVQSLMKPVRLYPSINVCLGYQGTICDLALKIGIDRIYNVNNILTLIQNIINKTEHSYGKYLSFRHSIESFDESSRDIIKLLKNYLRSHDRYSIFNYNNSKMKISKEIIEEMFDLLKGKTIDFSFEENGIEGTFLVSLKPISIGFKLNKKYKLTIVNNTDGFLLDLQNKIFCFKDSEIYQVNFPEKSMLSLYKFIRKNPDFTFKHIKDVFTKEILARYFNYIELDDNIKEEISLKEFMIKVYFDYIDDKINAKVDYFYDDKPISIEEINSNKYTSIQVDKLNLILNSFGFENNIVASKDKIYQFLLTDLTNLKEIASVYLSERLSNLQAKTYKPIKMNLSYNTGMLSICLEDSIYSDEELAKIIKGIRKKTRYIKLKNNVIIKIEDDDANRLLNTIDEFDLNANTLSKAQDVPLYQALKTIDKNLNIINYNKSNQLEEILNEIANYKNANYIIPNEVASSMRSYQKEAFLWMKTLIEHQFCGILADDMGLGKSLEMISVILSDNSQLPSLIVCPKSLCYNWKNEFELWAPSIKVINIIGTINVREEIIKNIDSNCIYITSYDTLRSDLKLYEGIKFQFMILDEAQYIKNHETLKAQSVKKINSNLRFVLTGTPIENTVLDLWSIFDFLMPGYLYNFTKFKTRYERSIIEKNDNKTISNLVGKISPFILRRTKQDVIKDLPDKYETIQSAKMTHQQRKIYEAELKRTREVLESSDNKIELLACLTRLRQVCVDPGLYVEGYKGGSGKVELTMELVDDYINNGSRILIFSQFTTIFESIKNLLEKKQIKYYLLTGKTPAAARVEMATDFNKNDNIKVFLVSLKAGGSGLNLIGADVVIHLDPWWNVAAENQATDRAHRIGQKRVVQVIKLVCEDSIEQKVIELQERKKEIVKMIVADDDSNILKLSKDDISYLVD